MQFINEAPLYKITRITGPKHNLLGLELASGPVETVILEALNNTFNSNNRIDAAELLHQVTIGVDRARDIFRRDFHVKRIQYVSSDTPSLDIYADLTFEILKRIEELPN